MGSYLFTRNFFLAVLVMLTRISAVDVNINEVTYYDGVHVVSLHEHLYNCFRHKPTEGSTVTRVLIGKDPTDLSLLTSAPYLDVLVRGTSKYFKVLNVNWFASAPFLGNKYNYYNVKNNELFPCDGLEYMKIYYQTFRRHFTLNLWRTSGYIYRNNLTSGRLSVPKRDACIEKVAVGPHTLWEYEKNKGALFAKALEREMDARSVITLYFLDLNDNEIEMDFIVWSNRASYISPWKGYPKKYDAPPERFPSAATLPRLQLIPLEIKAGSDLYETPLLKVKNLLHGEKSISIYITHPDAYIKKFITAYINADLPAEKPYLAAYRVFGNSAKLQVLLYESDTTTLFEITTERLHNGLIPVADPKVIIYSFPLYTEAEVDERMYTKRMLTIGGVDSAVYTARPHLSFSQVYHDGVPVFVEGEKDIIMEQFILQDSGIYVAVRTANGIGHGRFFMGRDDNEWQRAKDEYPDYIIF